MLQAPESAPARLPIQLKVIDFVAAKEKRNEFAYIFNHELGLYLGRLFGCGLFIVLARYVSDYVALRYALLVIAAVHFLGIFMAKSILEDKDWHEENATDIADAGLLKEPI